MTILIAIPIIRISCRVSIDKGRAWSIIDELILWAVIREFKPVGLLTLETGLPSQIIVASIARLMRFRLVEVMPSGVGVTFRASEFGFSLITSGHPLPFFPKRQVRRAGFIIECISGDFFPNRAGLQIMSPYRLDLERKSGADVRQVIVEGGGPSVSHEANLRRLTDIVAPGLDEEVVTIDGRTASLRDDEFMVVRVVDGVPRGIPERAGANLQQVIAQVTSLRPDSGRMVVGYSGPRDVEGAEPIARACTFDPADVIIGGSEQRVRFLQLLEIAHDRVIIHSTFLDAARFEALLDPIRTACLRGVTFDLLWGDDDGDEPDNRNARAATEMARMVRQDRHLNGRVRVHMRTTRSHAKVMMVSTKEGWAAAIGSCNWLSSPFNAVELTVVLRDNSIVADTATALQRLVGRRGLSDNIATEMALVARDLRRMGSGSGAAQVAIVAGESHDWILRKASGRAGHSFLVGSNRLGSTARPGAIMQGEAAAERGGITATILYTLPSGPLKNRHARALAVEAETNGVRLIKTRKIPLHGKFLAWDDDDIVITSLNWASASSDLDFPWGEIGVHIHMPGVASDILKRLINIFPELTESHEGQAEQIVAAKA